VRSVFVGEDAAFQFARLDGGGDGFVIDGPEDEDLILGGADQV